jgi:hypothetical protein
MTYERTMLQRNQRCLKPDPRTEWMLQSMLIFKAVCVIVVFVSSNRDVTLLCCPCSIAVTMVLLACSEMAGRRIMLQGNERNARTDLRKGWLLSLGWWGGVLKDRRFGIDVGRADKQYDVLATADTLIRPADVSNNE